MTIKQFIFQLKHNIKFVYTIKIIKYLKVLQHVPDHRGSIISEPCTVPSYSVNYTHTHTHTRTHTHTHNVSEYAAITPILSMSTDTIESFL